MDINFPLNFRTHSDTKQKLILEKGHFIVKVSLVSSAIGSAFHLCLFFFIRKISIFIGFITHS